eukprot:1257527-Lingulodinium_polyedra.AAC.1
MVPPPPAPSAGRTDSRHLHADTRWRAASAAPAKRPRQSVHAPGGPRAACALHVEATARPADGSASFPPTAEEAPAGTAAACL